MRGQIKIRYNAEGSQEPKIVYIVGKNRFGHYICDVLGTSETCFSSDENLIDFDYDKFKLLKLEWRIKNCDTLKERLITELNEINLKQ